MKSTVSFVRKQLGKGKTNHNGRGMYEMRFTDSLPRDQMESHIRKSVAKWQEQGLLELLSEDECFIRATFDRSQFDHWYRAFCYSKCCGDVTVTC